MKIFAKIFIFGLLLLFAGSSLVFADDVTDDYLDIAQNYYKEGNKGKALEYANQVLSIEENNIGALTLKYKLLPPTGSKIFPNIDRLLIFDTPYITTGNSNSDNFFKKGYECYKSNNFSGAETYFKNAIQSDPNNYQAYNALGLVYCAQNKLDLATSYFKKSNSINQTFTTPLNNLAQIYKKNGDRAKAFAILSQSQMLNDKDFCAYLLMGDLYRESGDYENALKNYRDSIKRKANCHLTYFKIAQTRADDLDYIGSNATLNYYQKFLNVTDDYVYYLMAKNYLVLNQCNKAKESIYKAISMNNCREYRELLGKINYQNDDFEDALEAFESSLSDKSPSDVYNYIGMCHYGLHDFNKAIKYVNKAISMSDMRVLYYYNLAQIYYTLKDNTNYSKCMALINKFKPSSCQDYIDLSGIYFYSESKNSAIAILDKGIDRYPRAKNLYQEKIKIYDLTNDTQGLRKTKTEMESIFK